MLPFKHSHQPAHLEYRHHLHHHRRCLRNRPCRRPLVQSWERRRSCPVKRCYSKRMKDPSCGSQRRCVFPLLTFLQFGSLHLSFSSGYPSMSVSFPHRYPLPAQPIPHWQDKWNPSETQTARVWSCEWQTCEILPDKWWSHPSLGCTGRWCHRGWSGCCHSWAPACSPSPDLLWSPTYSCRSDTSPAQERKGHLVFFGRRSKIHTKKRQFCPTRAQVFRWRSHHRVVTLWVFSAAAVVGSFALIDVVTDLNEETWSVMECNLVNVFRYNFELLVLWSISISASLCFSTTFQRQIL